MMFSIGTRSSTSFSKATDAELFSVMAEQGPASIEAWEEFYVRYVEDFYKSVCRLRGIPPVKIAGLVQETMIQAFWAAHTFQAGDVSNAKDSRQRTLAWLGRIGRRLYWSALRQQRGTFESSLSQPEGDDDSQLSTKGRRLSRGELYREIKDAEDVVSGGGNDEQVSLNTRLIREAMVNLSEREYDILFATFIHYERGQKQQRLPNAVVKEICETYGISPANVRQLRKRALAKIRRYVGGRISTKD